MKLKKIIAILIGVGLVVLAVSAVVLSQRDESAWRELRSLTELKEQFNRDKDAVRIILLLSPT